MKCRLFIFHKLGGFLMRYFRKIVGERLYLSPFNADDIEIYTKWAEWMNNKIIGDNYGGPHNLVSLANAKKTLEELKGYRFAIEIGRASCRERV